MAESSAHPDSVELWLFSLLDCSTDVYWTEVNQRCAAEPAMASMLMRRAQELKQDAAPERIGPYQILERVGRGGMGEVYKAEQREPVRRLVALKVVKEGMATKEVLARFSLERRALAAMNHRSIAKVLDAGATDKGEPYFVMEFVEGLPLTVYCDKHKLSIEQRLRVFQQVCAGVQHAHQKGIVHRDLKPDNVLVVREGEEHVPKILDFGLAKATNRDFLDVTFFTEQKRVMGTPQYMAPEQASGDGEAIDARADVYALGVMLYELLAGTLPFTTDELRKAGVQGALTLIRDSDPPRPSTKLVAAKEKATEVATRRQTSLEGLSRALRGDLDWVVMKAMAKEPERRYDAATSLADDLGRYLRHEPVLAGPPTVGYRLRKFVRKYRVQVVAAGLVLLAIAAGLTGMIWFAMKAEREALAAKKQEAVAQANAKEAAEQAALAKRNEQRAEDNAERAKRNAEDAQRNASLLADKVRELTQLAGLVRLRRALEREKGLYPAHPHQVAAMQAWLADVGGLLAMRDELGKTISDLRGRALAPTPEEIEDDKKRHPQFAQWEKQARKLAAFERAHAIRNGAELSLPQAARGEAGAEALASLREQVNQLSAAVHTRQTYRFADESQEFLHDTLSELQGGLAALEAKERAAVLRRLFWAERIEALTLGHPKARVTWEAAREAIKKADGVVASALYKEHPIDLPPQMGLVPIGMNPATKLWEFYDLGSAWDGKGDPGAIEIPQHVQDGERKGHIEVTDATGIVFVLLPGRTFTMGAQAAVQAGPNYDPRAQGDETPHPVTLAPFFLARHELTKGQWKRLSGGEDPSWYRLGEKYDGDRSAITDSHPVEQVDWRMCDELLRQHGLVLPTEAQWEYGCRAGTTTPWWKGEKASSLAGAANVLDQHAERQYPGWGRQEGDFEDGWCCHAPVGSYRPNAFGLFDVHGNVWEWCSDWYGDYSLGVRTGDGLRLVAERSSSFRVNRGGSFINAARLARSGIRNGFAPTFRHRTLGLRPARASRLGD